MKKTTKFREKRSSVRDSNPRPFACKANAITIYANRTNEPHYTNL